LLVYVHDLLERDDVLLLRLDEQPRARFEDRRHGERIDRHAHEHHQERVRCRPAALDHDLEVIRQVGHLDGGAAIGEDGLHVRRGLSLAGDICRKLQTRLLLRRLIDVDVIRH